MKSSARGRVKSQMWPRPHQAEILCKDTGSFNDFYIMPHE